MGNVALHCSFEQTLCTFWTPNCQSQPFMRLPVQIQSFMKIDYPNSSWHYILHCSCEYMLRCFSVMCTKRVYLKSHAMAIIAIVTHGHIYNLQPLTVLYYKSVAMIGSRIIFYSLRQCSCTHCSLNLISIISNFGLQNTKIKYSKFYAEFLYSA